MAGGLLSCVVAFAAVLTIAQAYVPPGMPSYTDLKNFTGQWNITVWVNHDVSDPSSSFVRHTCNATAYGAVCNQPTIREHTNAAVKIMWTQRNISRPFSTWKNGEPKEMHIRLNYMPVSQVDRGWRKKNQAYPEIGFHAKWTVNTIPFALTAGEAVWLLSEADEVTDALLYPEVCVECTLPDGTTEFCQCDRLNSANSTVTVETSVEGSITDAMRGSAIALSAFAPLLLIVYLMADNWYYKKHGRALQVVHLDTQ